MQPAVVRIAAATKSSGGDIVTLAPPARSPYLWSATKAADGSIAFAGFVPSQDVRETLTDSVAKISADDTTFAGGQPDGFAANSVAALSILDDLDTGKVAFDGTNWSVTGAVDSADKAAAAASAFAASPLKDLGAAYDVDGPATAAAAHPAAPATTAAPATPPVAAAPSDTAISPAPVDNAPAVTPPAAAPAPTATAAPATPAAADYTWSATKAPDGAITFAGSIANAKLKQFLDGRAGSMGTDNSTVAAGAPENFIGGALYGFGALSALDSGKLAFAEGKWSLSGTAASDAASKAAMAALDGTDTRAWAFDIAVAPPAAPPAPTAGAPAQTSAAPAATAAESYDFNASKTAGGTIVLSGDVPNEAVKANLGAVAGDVPVDGLNVAPGAPDNFVNEAVGGLAALEKLDSGAVTLADGKWSVKGQAATPELHDSILASIADLPAGKDWTTAIAGPPPLVACRAKLADVLKAGPAVNFDKATHFAKGVEATLDAIASALALCPDARVDVAGNTDADGNANANMALSVARAEAVTDALAKRGVAASRLYAIGYGETLPLVPNTTRANKAKNRRIDFKVEAAKK